MKRFLKHILFFSIGFVIIDKFFLPVLLVAPQLEVDNRLEQVINGKMNKEILIFGSSRGAQNIMASQIEDSLGRSTYNLSYQGSGITYHEFLLSTVLKFNKKPEIVLLTLDDPIAFVNKTKAVSFKYNRLYPLAKYKYINEELIDRGDRNWLSRYFVLSRLNTRNLRLWKKSFTPLDTIRSNGSIPIAIQKPDRDWLYVHPNEIHDFGGESVQKIEAFLNFQALCYDNGIDLILVFPPNFYPHDQEFEDHIKGLSSERILSFRYDTLDHRFKDSSYFYDESHLKWNGAIIFTDQLIAYLKENGY